MELLPELLKIILDLVCDTRGYACTAKLAWTQCATRPDHAVWQRIRSLNDYFVYGTESITTWALASVPALATLDSAGLECALANAVRADNPSAVHVLAKLIPDDKFQTASRFCGPKTREFFTKPPTDWKYCTCPAEFGVSLSFIGISNLHRIFANTKISDGYLLQMAAESQPYVYQAAYYNRINYVLGSGEGCWLQAIRGAVGGNNIRLLLAAKKHHDVDAKYIERTTENAINDGRVEEFEPGSCEHIAASKMLSAALGHGDEMLKNAGLGLLSVIAEHCSDETVSGLINTHRARQELEREVVKQGRPGLASNFEISDLAFHKNSIKWAAEHNVKIHTSYFIHSTIDLYVFAQELDILN